MYRVYKKSRPFKVASIQISRNLLYKFDSSECLERKTQGTGLHENAECRSTGVRSPGVLKMRSVENAEC